MQRLFHELRQDVDGVAQFKASKSEISIFQRDVGKLWHQIHVHHLLLQARDYIECILAMRKENSFATTSYFDTKKIFQLSKVLHVEALTEIIFEFM